MRFKLVKPGCVEVRTYNGGIISTGDTVELDGHLADKASRNPNYAQVKAEPVKKKAVKKAAKKKNG